MGVHRVCATRAPHRSPPRPANDHDASITTDAPNVMWGADGAWCRRSRTATSRCYRRRALERRGPRLARRQTRRPLRRRRGAGSRRRQGLRGSVRADAARRVLLRHDHCSAFMSEHFQNQLTFFGMAPSFAFVRQPETNGVAERFIRTLKEQLSSTTGHRGGPHHRQGLFRALQRALAFGKERLPKPRRNTADLDGLNHHHARGRITLHVITNPAAVFIKAATCERSGSARRLGVSPTPPRGAE
jgi:hypothetical protein